VTATNLQAILIGVFLALFPGVIFMLVRAELALRAAKRAHDNLKRKDH
jgi:uncharacterized membrane protein YbaN (DUF454 family)